MYIYSELTGKTYKNIDGFNYEVIQDDRLQSWKDMENWIKQGNEVLFVESTPEEIAEANKPIVQNLKLEQYQELSPTDWYYTRYIETGQEVPLEIKQQRQEIRDKYNNLIENINNDK